MKKNNDKKTPAPATAPAPAARQSDPALLQTIVNHVSEMVLNELWEGQTVDVLETLKDTVGVIDTALTKTNAKQGGLLTENERLFVLLHATAAICLSLGSHLGEKIGIGSQVLKAGNIGPENVARLMRGERPTA